ncbi:MULTISPECIES: cellulose biosynthesis protein BcsD [Paraburkholderia]|uniref:cellulose biosynthesis protein BcsD n=1 Tax=Paraburkholderia TaxID=1822464 RepID=UPI001CB44B98|nr:MULTISPECIES: cellulose biosynthesis protein BcsD [Paraburkholderia]GJH01798.1 cellulose synthase [Paraburkholderia terrae]CAG9272410.1 Cellulose synthase [Paraburkholderia caribensis]
MQDEHTATLLDYYTRHQTSVQWRGFLTALAEEFETQIDTSQLRVLMSRIGVRFAARYPAAECTTLDDLAAFLNNVWSGLDWGFVRLAERDDYLSIEHCCAPLAAFGERAAPWASAFLEGAYQHWLHELGAGSLALQEYQSANAHAYEFRLLKAP